VIGQLDLLAAMVHDRLADADWSTKRNIICTLVKRIEVTAERVRIVFRVDPGSSAPSELRRNLPYCPTRRCYARDVAQQSSVPALAGTGRVTRPA
jgi:site-specific DNA recombinase